MDIPSPPAIVAADPELCALWTRLYPEIAQLIAEGTNPHDWWDAHPYDDIDPALVAGFAWAFALAYTGLTNDPAAAANLRRGGQLGQALAQALSTPEFP